MASEVPVIATTVAGVGELVEDGVHGHLVHPGDAGSEEHTSELQSLTNLVCRLLLEKKKNKQETEIHVYT